MKNRLSSERVIVSAPLSFAGSTQRIWKITRSNNNAVKWLILIPAAVTLIFISWIFITFWYLVMYVLFGLFFIPFRLWRRGARKNKRNELRHRELLEAARDSKL